MLHVWQDLAAASMARLKRNKKRGETITGDSERCLQALAAFKQP